jgi:hypothetical protein
LSPKSGGQVKCRGVDMEGQSQEDAHAYWWQNMAEWGPRPGICLEGSDHRKGNLEKGADQCS